MKKIFEDDVTAAGGAKLEVFTSNQGDLYLRVHNEDKTKSDTVCFCGPGGGSNYPGLAVDLINAFEAMDGEMEVDPFTS